MKTKKEKKQDYWEYPIPAFFSLMGIACIYLAIKLSMTFVKEVIK